MKLILSHQTFLLQKVIADVSHCIENTNLKKNPFCFSPMDTFGDLKKLTFEKM